MKIAFKKIILLFAVPMILTACDAPKNVALTPDPSKWSDKINNAAKKLSEEDKKYLAGYVFRAALGSAFGSGEGIPPGTTIGDAIEIQKKWIAAEEKKKNEAEQLKAKMASQQADFDKQLASTLTVAVIEKKILPANYKERFRDQIILRIGIENKSEKDIAGLKGIVSFYNMFNDKVATVPIINEDGIPAHQTIVWGGAKDFNQFEDNDKALAQLENGKYTTSFSPQVIIFTDGTKLQVPQ